MARYGSIGAMGDLSDRLDELSRIPSRAATAASASINELLSDQFANGTDPYGNAWAGLADRTLLKHPEPPLQAEFGGVPGPMAEGTFARPMSGAGIELTVPFPGGIHQTGAKRSPNWRMPKRAILPDKGTLPAAWKSAIDAAMSDAANSAMRGGGR